MYLFSRPESISFNSSEIYILIYLYKKKRKIREGVCHPKLNKMCIIVCTFITYILYKYIHSISIYLFLKNPGIRYQVCMWVVCFVAISYTQVRFYIYVNINVLCYTRLCNKILLYHSYTNLLYILCCVCKCKIVYIYVGTSIYYNNEYSIQIYSTTQ